MTTADDIRTLRRLARHRRGRQWLCGLFIVLCVPDILLSFAAIHSGERHFIGIAVIICIWTSSLLVAIGARWAWARHMLMLVLAGMTAAAVLIAAAGNELSDSVRLALVCGIPFYMIGLLILTKVESVWDLVSRAKD